MSSAMNLKLQKIVEEAYELFQGYRIGKELHLCSHCVSDEEMIQLINTPLREVSAQLMNLSYYFSAHDGTAQELHEMKHFLPRVMELVAHRQDVTHSTELNFDRLQIVGKPGSWSNTEIELLNCFAEEHFLMCITEYPSINGFDAQSVFVMYGYAGLNIEALLNSWLSLESTNAVLHLYDFLRWCDFDKFGKIIHLRNAFASEKVSEIAVEWLNSSDTVRHFIKLIERLRAEDALAKISDENSNKVNRTYQMILGIHD
jgi:hypothetical protein